MTNIVKLKKMSTVLKNKYNKNIILNEILKGRDKDVYLATVSEQEKFIVLNEKKNTKMRNYRTLQSNYFQKELQKKGINVADVIDIFEEKTLGVIAIHKYLEGTQTDTFDTQKAILCGKIVAQIHNANIKIKYNMCDFSYKYAICAFIKGLRDFSRFYKTVICDKTGNKLPRGTCHRDLNLGNFIFINEDVYLIDFDRHSVCPFVYELRRFLDSEQNRYFTKDFMTGYLSMRNLNTDEQAYLLMMFPELKVLFNT
ncbi:MAG: phosphotransferase [Alphaproteobacteria bacterium]|nr:phosphotransferase [Alphaproteobacteria bacterium]